MRRSFFRFNEERFLHGIFVLCLLSDMGHGKAKANGKAKHECHVCGKSGHHSTSCPPACPRPLEGVDQSSVEQKICQSTCGSRNICVAWAWSLGHVVLWKKPVDIVVLPSKLGKLLLPHRKAGNRLGSEVLKRSTKKRITCASLAQWKIMPSKKNALKKTSSKPTTILKSKPGCGNRRHVPAEDRGKGLPTKSRNIVDGVACSGGAQTAADSAMSWITACFRESACLCLT